MFLRDLILIVALYLDPLHSILLELTSTNPWQRTQWHGGPKGVPGYVKLLLWGSFGFTQSGTRSICLQCACHNVYFCMPLQQDSERPVRGGNASYRTMVQCRGLLADILLQTGRPAWPVPESAQWSAIGSCDTKKDSNEAGTGAL